MGGACSSPKNKSGDAYCEIAVDAAAPADLGKGKSNGGPNAISRSRSFTAIQARPRVFSERVDTTRLSFRDESPHSPKDVSQIGQDLLVSILKNFFYITSSESMLKAFMKDLLKVVVVRGETLMKQGEKGDKMYLLERGLLDVLRNGHKVDNILPGHVVGELALLFDEPRTATIVASAQESVLWSLDRTTFQTIQAANTLQSRSRAANFIKGSGVLDKLRLYTLRRLAAAMSRRDLKPGEVLLTAGDATEVCYLLESGTLAVPTGAAECPAGLLGENAQGMPIAKKGCFLGQMILLGAAGMPGGEAYDAAALTCTSSLSAEAVGACRVSFFTLSTFRELIGPVEAALKGGHEEHFGKGAKMTTHLVAGLSWNDFTVEGLLGEGAFGAVVLATCNNPSEESMVGKLFGVKILSKANITRGNNVKAVWNERDSLTTFKHPLVIGLDATFQTADNLFLVTPYVTACTMFEMMYSIDPNTQDPIGLTDRNRSAAARAWMAQVLEGLSHIHHQGCAYRDIKPENLLIDKDGRVIIIDLGFTKKIPYSTLHANGVQTEHDESYTLCGTYEYLAPEFFLDGCGHNHAVDYWAMGVLLFEVLYGRTPFVDQPGENDLPKLFRRICTTTHKPYKFPLNFDDKAHIPKLAKELPKNACRSMVAKLLEPTASKRLGNLAGGPMDIKNHPYFAGTDWEALASPSKVHPDTVKPPGVLLDQTQRSMQEGLHMRPSSIADEQPFNGSQNPFYGW